jgi:hypothetical protein
VAPVSKSHKESGNVVPLRPRRGALERHRGSQRVEALFATADPVAAIRALPADEFFYVVHELGFPDALDVLIHGTAEQVQGVLDLAIWDNDQVSLERGTEWLAAIAQAPYETIGAWARGLDVELLALLLRQRARVHELSEEQEAPDDIEGALFTTPDRLFALELLGDETTQRITQHLVEDLYRADQNLMRRLLVSLKGEMDSELEETAYRWRTGRMADLGFVDFYEALEIYRELDPASVRLPSTPPAPAKVDEDAPRVLPLAMAERLSGSTPFARAVAGLEPGEAARVHQALALLCNQVLSADRVSPGDDEAVAGVLGRVAATLDLGLEYLQRRDQTEGTAAVRGLPLALLFRLGVSLMGKLRKLARSLETRSPFARLRPQLDLRETDDVEVLGSVTRLRPMFPRLLDNPPEAGVRPFGKLADLTAASAAVERAGAALALLLGLGVRPEQLAPDRWSELGIADPAELDAGVLARTILVRRLLGDGTEGLLALSDGEVSDFKQRFGKVPQETESMVKSAAMILQAAAPGGRFSPASEAVASRWLQSLAPLGPVLRKAP